MIYSFLRKYLKKILLVLLAIFFLLSTTYANSTIDQAWNVFTNFFMWIVNLVWAIWMIFPIIAWKLMTNDLVYWSSLNFDVVLWQIWNFSRAFANFIIWFLFIYFIFKYIVSFSWKDISIIKTNLPKIAIASIVVNMSWFLLAIMIDLSTILIAWFGSLPSVLWEQITEKPLALPKTIKIYETKCTDKTDNSCKEWFLQFKTKWEETLNLKQLQSYETSISWPLLFLWNSILWINTSIPRLLNQAYDTNTHKLKKSGPAIKALIQISIFILFLVPMIILIIINIVRLFWIWIYIAFSPLIFLDQIFWWKLGTKQKALAFKNMVWLIFQPVLVVLSFSIASIFLIWIWESIIKDKWAWTKYDDNVKKVFNLDNSTNWLAKIEWWNMQDNGKDFLNFIWWFLWYLIISILIIIILWSMIKLSFQATEITKWISNSMFEFAEDITKTIPIKTPFWEISYGSLWYLWQKIEAIPSWMVGKQAEKISKILNQKTDIAPNTLNDIDKKIKDTNPKTKKDWLNEALSKLIEYKWEVYLKTNTKKLLDMIVKEIESTIFTKSNIKTELKAIKNYDEKIDYIAKNIDSIKKWFWIE